MSQHVLGGVRSQPDQLGASGEEPQGLADDQSDDTDAEGMMSTRGCPLGGKPNADNCWSL